jgi:hypothetical protein
MTPASLFEELLRYRTVKSAETAYFARMSHDDICRAIQEKLNLLLGAFVKYQHIAYMVQGPRDNGVDVLLKCTLNDDEPEKFFGIQVKSHKELEDRKNELAQKLKAGFHDATHSYGSSMERYYILLCGDANAHAKRISGITNEFSKSSLARVIDPRHIMSFLEMSASTIASVVDRHLSDEDFVRNRARHEAAGYSAKQLYFVLACICCALSNANDLLPEDFFENDSRLVEMENRFGNGAIVECLDISADTELETYVEPYSRRVRLEIFGGIRALYYDLQVRYEEDDDDLFNHLYEFLNDEVLEEAEDGNGRA